MMTRQVKIGVYILIELLMLTQLVSSEYDWNESSDKSNELVFNVAQTPTNETYQDEVMVPLNPQVLMLYHWIDWLLIRYSIVIVVLGIIANAVNFACFYRMKKRNAQNLYLGALSVAEILNILMNIALPLVIRLSKDFNVDFNSILFDLFKFRIDDKFKLFCCILYSYLIEVCLLVPVWIMVILALERFVSITWPLRKNKLSTRRQAKCTLSILITVVLLWCTFKLKTAGVEEYSTFDKFEKDDFEQEQEVCKRELSLPTMVNISTVLWAIVPELLTLLLNLFIIHRIRLTTNINRKFYSSERTRKITQATRVVLLLSIIFVLLISPSGVLLVFEFLHRANNPIPKELSEQVRVETNFMIARKIVIMLYETNLIISFPIYLVTINNFKETVKGFVPNISKLKRRDSSQIGVKDENHNRPRSENSRAKPDSSNKKEQAAVLNNNANELKMHPTAANILQQQKSHMLDSDESQYQQLRSGSAAQKSSGSSSGNNNTTGGYNDKCRLTISFHNKTALYRNNSLEEPAAVVADTRAKEPSKFLPVEIFEEFSNSRNFSSKIWSWFSSQNYLSVDEDEETPDRQTDNRKKKSNYSIFKQDDDDLN